MLPSSHRLLQKEFEYFNKVKIGDIKRYYKTPLKPGDATDAGDKPKFAHNKSYINHRKNHIENTTGLEKYNNGTFSEFSSSLIESIEPDISENNLQSQSRISNYNRKYIKYPFSDKHSAHLSHDIDEIYNINSESNTSEVIVELCVYHINYSAYKPFLEFMLYKSADDETFYFPNFTQNLSDYDMLENASIILNGLFGNKKITFKGRIIESGHMNNIKTANINNRAILVYEVSNKYTHKDHIEHRDKNDKIDDDEDIDPAIQHFKNDDYFHWVTIFEIFNIRKLLFYDISDTVIDVFLAYTQMVKLYYKDSLVETPMVVFYGSDKNMMRYISVFSTKKSNNESRYGPFYYFTDLYTSMKYACYDLETHEKHEKGGVVRFVIYPGKVKMFLKKDKPDKSLMAKYVMNKYPVEKHTAQFRDNDCNWVENYNSAYNGAYIFDINERHSTQRDSDYDDSEDNDFIHKYSISSDDEDVDDDDDAEDNAKDKQKHNKGTHSHHNHHIYHLGMRICIRNYVFQTPLSFYYINTDNIPNKYEYDFKNYKII
jgi:hypothetical protein